MSWLIPKNIGYVIATLVVIQISVSRGVLLMTPL